MPAIHRPKPMLILAAALGLAGTEAPLCAQDVERLIERPAAAPVRPQLETTIVEEALFGGTAEEGRRQLDALLGSAIADLTRSAEIDEAQKKKLWIAGRGDIHRYLNRVEELKTRLASDGSESNIHALGINGLRRSLNLQLFGDGSLFAKAIRSVLTAEQLDSYERTLKAEQRHLYESLVATSVESLGQSLNLSDNKQRQLVRLMLEQTRPPRTFSRNDQRVVLLKLSRLPEESLRPLFNPDQWNRLQQIHEANRQYVAHLVKTGQLPEYATDAEPVAGAAGNTQELRVRP